MKEYKHDLTGTIICDQGDGRLVIDLRYTPHDEVFASQADWFVETVEGIAKETGHTLDFLFDMTHYETSIWNELMRARCRQMVEDSSIARKIAIVGDSISYFIVCSTLATLKKNRDRIKFFFEMEEAKQWLGWNG